MKIPKLSKSEQEIMDVLWAEGRPLSRAEILELSTEKSWKPSSIHILLNSLLDKQAIVVDGFSKTGSHYGRTFAPAFAEGEGVATQIKQMVSYQRRPGETVSTIFSALMEDNNLTDEDLDNLEEILRRNKN